MRRTSAKAQLADELARDVDRFLKQDGTIQQIEEDKTSDIETLRRVRHHERYRAANRKARSVLGPIPRRRSR